MTPDHFDFSHALSLLKQGKRVARKGWEEWGEVASVEIWGTKGEVLLATGAKGRYPWVAKQPDMLAKDWHEVTGG